MKLPPQVAPSPRVLSTAVGEELVLLDAEAGVYYGLDAVGARVWHLLSEGRSTHDVLATIPQEFEVPLEVFEADLAALLGELKRLGLVAFDDAH